MPPTSIFFKIPPEIRDRIYQELLVSPEPIESHLISSQRPHPLPCFGTPRVRGSKTIRPGSKHRVIVPDCPLSLAILGTSRRVYSEAIHSVYARNRFRFVRAEYICPFLEKIGPGNAAKLRHISMPLPTVKIPWSLRYLPPLGGNEEENDDNGVWRLGDTWRGTVQSREYAFRGGAQVRSPLLELDDNVKPMWPSRRDSRTLILLLAGLTTIIALWISPGPKSSTQRLDYPPQPSDQLPPRPNLFTPGMNMIRERCTGLLAIETSRFFRGFESRVRDRDHTQEAIQMLDGYFRSFAQGRVLSVIIHVLHGTEETAVELMRHAGWMVAFWPPPLEPGARVDPLRVNLPSGRDTICLYRFWILAVEDTCQLFNASCVHYS
ncbi:hypothetical protein B0H63DRAFT_454087 [Podospora didyma]|uniref:DUF7730 domain-containing protein n=1 Tax=Podospora didyma TaxID=330526 RepID=A0AAE0N4H5_9PEZI|nr:hypothetical protein B0H63DRAFT_454087 [Podospora didyma]